MNIRSRRTVAVLAMAGAAASAVSLAAVQAGRIREEWYLWLLGSGQEVTRQTAARRLSELRVVRAIPRLLRLVGGRELTAFERGQPSWALGALSTLAMDPRAIPFLGTGARDVDPGVRLWAIVKLSNMRPSGVTAIGDALGDPEVEVRRDAARALEALGVDAEPAVRSLVLALADVDAGVRKRAMLTLRKVGAHAAISELLTRFESEPASRPFLAAALLDFYPSRLAPGDALREALDDTRPDLVEAVIDETRRSHDLEPRIREAER